MTTQELQQLIISNIYDNTSGDISGSILQNILLQISNKLSDGLYFGGVVSDESSLTPDTNSFYICLNDGTYQSFGDVVVESSPKVQYLIYDNILENWNVEEFPIPTFDFVNIAESCLWGGVVTPNEEPIHGNDHRYFYLAFQEGRYTHFNNYYVDSNVCLFYWREGLSNWAMLALWPNTEFLDELFSSKASKPSSSTNGHIAGLTSEGDLTDSGIAADDVATQQDLATKQDTIQDLSTIRSGAAAGATALQSSDITPIENAVSIIESVIPNQASAQNQLADKNFVNSQVTTASANFVGTFETLEELQAVQNPTKNDYGFVIETDALGNQYYDRYKYNGTAWLFEYKVESTSFTSEQWAAIQSGITSGLVQTLGDISENYLKTGESAGTGSVDFDEFADTVHNIPQTLSSSQKQQARQNIDAVSGNDLKTLNGQSLVGNGNIDIERHFKGWFNSLAELKAAYTAEEGDAAYVKDASPATTWSIYVYDSTATTDNNWADSGTDADTSNVQTFASSQEVNEVHIVNDLTTGGVHNILCAEQGKIIGNKLDFGFVDVDNSHFLKNGTINSSGSYTSNTSAKIYRYQIKAGQRIVFYVTASSTAYCVLSFSTSQNPTSFSMIMMYITNGSYYSYVAPSDGYAFVLIQTNASGKVWLVNPQEPELNEFGVKKYTFGENAIQKYVGSDVTDTSLWGSGFFTSTGSITSGSGYHYSKEYIPVLQGSYIQAGMTFSNNARLCYYDANKTFLSAVSTGNATTSTVRAIPTNAAYMRFCMSNTDTSRLSFIYQNEGMQIVDVPEINALNGRVSVLEQNAIKRIDNNLLNEGNKIAGWKVGVSTDGSTYTYSNDNYGQPNVMYVVPVDNSAKVLHVKFRFKFTQPLAETSSSTNHNLLIIGSTDSYRAALRQNAFSYNSANYILQRTQYFVVQQTNNVSDITLDNLQFKQLEGSIAYSLEYKGTSYSSAVNYKLQLTSTAINVYDSDGTTVLETISIDTDELVSSVVDKVNNTSNYLKAVPYEVDGTKYTDCMNGSVKFPLCASSSSSRPWMISKKLDEKWHTFECVLDYSTLKSYTNIDGATVYRAITEPTSKTLYIGGAVNFSAYKMVPVLFRDLHIGYDYEDAEIITYPNNVSGTLTRLISNESPYLMIFEGHDIENKMNKDMPTGSDTYMATSTDTLRTVFDTLRSKGFVPVSWQDIIRWKKYGGKLPKRCYTLMFDDWRLANYMNLDLRKPFVEYGVKPGLAVITSGEDGTGDTEDRNTQITIDGNIWTVGECFDAIIKGGWYPCSHTKNHTVLINVKDMELFSLLKDCIYSCDKLGIYDDIIVYPTGSVSEHKKLMMMVSGFAIGVKVAVNGYNCLSSLDFNLIRNEIGSRKNITTILAQIV